MGKSRYAPLVKLKKKSLDRAEHSLISANNEVSGAAERLDRAYETLSALTLPQHGSVAELFQANHLIQTQHTIIEDSKEALDNARERQEKARNAFNQARIDYEKFKYLEVQEMNLKIKKIKEGDAKQLDEIGTMMFKRETV